IHRESEACHTRLGVIRSDQARSSRADQVSQLNLSQAGVRTGLQQLNGPQLVQLLAALAHVGRYEPALFHSACLQLERHLGVKKSESTTTSWSNRFLGLLTGRMGPTQQHSPLDLDQQLGGGPSPASLTLPDLGKLAAALLVSGHTGHTWHGGHTQWSHHSMKGGPCEDLMVGVVRQATGLLLARVAAMQQQQPPKQQQQAEQQQRQQRPNATADCQLHQLQPWQRQGQAAGQQHQH
ncbi:hypothetical protein QJQ45_021943, partial [Haematococcus lacustris]